ncbi:MAG TPA: acyltransferase [Acidobacteriaceae bacterium]|nr:acyltransferase [Acidobacteriaceae bacterium]
MPPTPPVAGNTEGTAPANRTYYPALDGLRAIAFLLVLLQHYARLPWGWSGVNIFFVLSGFLITGILWDTRDDPHRARNFYIRRSLRIFPLFYAVFLLLLLSTPLLHWRWSLSWLAWPLYVGNFLRFLGHGGLTAAQQSVADAQLHSRTNPFVLYLGHFWSLCVEEQFYLLWPWVVFAIRSRRKLILLCLAVVLLTPLLRVFTQHHAPAWMLSGELLYRLLPFQLDSLLLGGMLALLWRGSHRGLLRHGAAIVAALCTALVLLHFAWAAHTFGAKLRDTYIYPQWRLTWGLSFINLFSAALIVCALHPGSFVCRLLHRRPLRALGRISYGAYVLHDIPHSVLLGIVLSAAHNSTLVAAHAGAFLVALALGFIVVAAAFSYKFLESPFLNLKSRLTRTASRAG